MGHDSRLPPRQAEEEVGDPIKISLLEEGSVESGKEADMD